MIPSLILIQKRNKPDSAAAWSLELDGKWQGKLLRPLIDGLFYFVQKDHCAQAWQWQRHLYKKE